MGNGAVNRDYTKRDDYDDDDDDFSIAVMQRYTNAPTAGWALARGPATFNVRTL